MFFRFLRISVSCQRWLAGGFIFCLLVLLSPQGARAQGLSGINGTITDESGAVVPGVAVTATNNATAVSTRGATTSVGAYTITDLIPGAYTVKFEKAGFQTAVLNNVYVDAGKFATADTVLKVGSVTQMVEVTAAPVVLETTQPQIGTVVENKIAQEVPTLIGGGPGNVGPRDRQIDDLIFLAPGVTGGEFEHRINGGVSYQNEVMFNGVAAIQAETQGFQSNINPPFEMVNQIEVLTSNFGAQYGLAQGVASYQFASGTNHLHGDAFEVLRNTALNAAGVNPPGTTPTMVGPTPIINQHNYGFSVGGPVIFPKLYNGKNKTFFFMSVDWFRQNQTDTATMTVPTPAEVAGDFSGYPYPIFVPQNFVAPPGCTAPPPGQQWPNNTIPQSCFSAISKSLLAFIPAPAFPGLVNNENSLVGVLPTRQSNWGFSIDHSLTDKQKLHGSFWRDKYNLPSCCDQNAHFNNELSGEKQEPRLGTGLFLTYSNTISDHLVMTAGVGWMGEINDELNSHLGVHFPAVVDSISLPTIQFSAPFGAQPTSWGVGYTGNGETFSINRKLGLTLDNNFLYARGRHNFNIGWEARRAFQDDHECQPCGGRFNFTSRTTADPNNINTTGSAFASFLLGDVDSAYRQFVAENRLRNLLIAPYVQDNIKVTPRLTVNAGLRWDVMRPFTESNNNVVFFDPGSLNSGAINPATGKPLLGVANKFLTAGYTHADISWHHFSPRAGFAYELNNKTVVMGGYAVNFLDGGPYEFGNNKLSVQYGGLLTGIVNVSSFGSNIPHYGEWDNNPLAVPVTAPFNPTTYNGTGVLHQFSRTPGKYPYTQTWNAGIQRRLPWDTFLYAAYVGNRQLHMPSMLNPVNQTDPAYLGMFCPSANPSDPSCLLSPASSNFAWTSVASQAALQSLGFGQFGGFYTPYDNFMNDWGASAGLSQALLPYPMYSPSESCGGLCNPFDMNGVSTYNALQIQAQKRFTTGLSYLVNYTVSRTISNTDSGFASFNWGAENKANQRSEYAIAANDQTHIVNISGVYELPIGPGKRFLNKGGLLAKNALGGWQLSAILSYASGTPNTIYCWDNDPFLNGFNRCNYDPSVPLNVNYHNYYKGGSAFNTAAFSDPGFAQGNEPRNLGQLRSPFSKNENLALAKYFFFGERVKGELRIEFFNIFNRVIVCGADTSLTDGPNFFGFVNPNGSGGSNPCQANTPRQGQGVFKLYF
jgi:hypothetical protein